MRPDLIVTQGQEAKNAMSTLVERTAPAIDRFTVVGDLNGTHVFWLHTYHPNNYKLFNPQRAFNKGTQVAEGFERYATAMQEFIDARKYA